MRPGRSSTAAAASEPATGRRGVRRSRLLAFLLAASVGAVAARWAAPCWSSQQPSASSGRRSLFLATAAITAATLQPQGAEAFKNRVAKYPGVKRRDAPEPFGGLGLKARSSDTSEDEIPELLGCKKSPNCFSTSFEPQLDVPRMNGVEPWKYEGKSPAQAMKEINDVLAAYQPGQQDIDGGGFQFQPESDAEYIHVKYESLKFGYIDDVEFAVKPGTQPNAQSGQILLRSGSRLGYGDYGVNAARLNTIAEALRKKGGWTCPDITPKSHPGYWDKLCTLKKNARKWTECDEVFEKFKKEGMPAGMGSS